MDKEEAKLLIINELIKIAEHRTNNASGKLLLPLESWYIRRTLEQAGCEPEVFADAVNTICDEMLAANGRMRQTAADIGESMPDYDEPDPETDLLPELDEDDPYRSVIDLDLSSPVSDEDEG